MGKKAFNCPFLIHLPINYDRKQGESDGLPLIRLGIKFA
jgi:hypothetical protein